MHFRLPWTTKSYEVKDSLAEEDDNEENIETKDEKTEEEIMKALGDKTIE